MHKVKSQVKGGIETEKKETRIRRRKVEVYLISWESMFTSVCRIISDGVYEAERENEKEREKRESWTPSM